MNLSLSILGRTFSLGTSKATSPGVAAWLRGDDVDSDSPGAKLTTPYSQSAWVYIAVSRLAEKVASIPFRISRVSRGQSRRIRALRGTADGRQRRQITRALGEDILDSGDVVDLFNHPHPSMPANIWWEMLITWLALRGEAFILPLDDSDAPVDLSDRAPRVQRLITLEPGLFWEIVAGYDLQGWRYTGSPILTPIESQTLLPGEVVHIRTPNPYQYWRGMSPLLVANLPAGADYAAAKYSHGYWQNNADTGVIVTTDQSPGPEQRAAILAALRERKRKAGTADRPAFLWGGVKIEKPQLSGMETQFIENRRMNRQEIGAIWKVPESVMGFSESKSNALSGGGQAINAEQIQFIESAITPLCRRAEAALDPVIRTFGDDLVGWFDIDSLPVMQEARRSRLDSATKAFALGAALNDINELYDLGFPDYPWGKTGYLPFGLQPAGEIIALPSEDETADNADNADKPEESDTEPEDEEKSNPFLRMKRLLAKATTQRSAATAALWRSHVRARLKSVKTMQSKVNKVLFEFRTTALAKLATHPVSVTDHCLLFTDDSQKRSLVDVLFDPSDFGLKLVQNLTPSIQGALKTAAEQVLAEIGADADAWSMPPAEALAYVGRRTQPIKHVGGTVRDQLNTTLQEGLDAGETTEDLARRVKTTFNKLASGEEGMTVSESMRVARTETNMAYGFSRQEAIKGAGVEYKSWLSSHGPNVREGHAQAEDTYSDEPIPVDEPFMVPNADGLAEPMMFPGDDSLGASAGNIINCQCIQLAAVKAEESEETTTYNVIGLGRLTYPKKA